MNFCHFPERIQVSILNDIIAITTKIVRILWDTVRIVLLLNVSLLTVFPTEIV